MNTPETAYTLENPLRNMLKEIILAASAPIKLADIKKELTSRGVATTGKGAVKSNEIEEQLKHLVDGKAIFEHPSTKWWFKPLPTLRETLITQVSAKLHNASKPLTKTQLVSRPKTAGAEFDDALNSVIDQLISDGKLYSLPDGKYSKDKPPSQIELIERAVRAKLQSGNGPFTKSQLASRPRGAGPDFDEALSSVIDQLIRDGKLYLLSDGKYSKDKPPSQIELIERAVRAKLQSGDGPFTKSQLLSRPRGAGNDFTADFEAVLKKLLDEKTCYAHPGEKYSSKPPQPPAWYELTPQKAEFDKLFKAAKKLVQEQNVKFDDIVAVLRLKLGIDAAPTPAPTVPPTTSPPVVVPPPLPPVPHKDLRTVLKEAYDELCLYVEFRDKLVEMPRLYHEAKSRKHDLTVQQFHDELWQMAGERKLQLHVLNELNRSKEPELAINHEDKLYYFVIWN